MRLLVSLILYRRLHLAIPDTILCCELQKVCHYLGDDKGGGGSRQTVTNDDKGGGGSKIRIFAVKYFLNGPIGKIGIYLKTKHRFFREIRL